MILFLKATIQSENDLFILILKIFTYLIYSYISIKNYIIKNKMHIPKLLLLMSLLTIVYNYTYDGDLLVL